MIYIYIYLYDLICKIDMQLEFKHRRSESVNSETCTVSVKAMEGMSLFWPALVLHLAWLTEGRHKHREKQSEALQPDNQIFLKLPCANMTFLLFRQFMGA